MTESPSLFLKTPSGSPDRTLQQHIAPAPSTSYLDDDEQHAEEHRQGGDAAGGSPHRLSDEEKRSTLHRWGEKLYHLVSPGKQTPDGSAETSAALDWGQFSATADKTSPAERRSLRVQDEKPRGVSMDSQRSFATLHESAAAPEYRTPEKAAETRHAAGGAGIPFPLLGEAASTPDAVDPAGEGEETAAESTIESENARNTEALHAIRLTGEASAKPHPNEGSKGDRQANTPSRYAEFDPLLQESTRRSSLSRQPLPTAASAPLLSFGTPAVPRASGTQPILAGAPTAAAVPAHTGGGSEATRNQMNYMDMLNVYQSPASMHRFSERDIEIIKQQSREKLENEYAKVIRDKDEQLRVAIEEREEMKKLMDGYTETMQHMMKDSKQSEDMYLSQIARLKEDRDRLQRDGLTIENSFRDLRVRFEDVKLLNETYKMTEEKTRMQVKDLQTSLQATNERYDALKAHAGAKLEQANTEVAQYKQTYEGQIMLLKTKLSRTEMKLSNLETDIERKTKENVDLLKMCDELIAQLDCAR